MAAAAATVDYVPRASGRNRLVGLYPPIASMTATGDSMSGADIVVNRHHDRSGKAHRRVMRRRARAGAFVAVLAAVAGLLTLAPPASAATAPPVLWTFSAAKPYSGNAAGYFLADRDKYCPAGKPISSSLTLPKALANARSAVVTLAGSQAVNAFAHSATAESATASRAAAVGMFAGRKPVPALLALLRVHQLQPNDPSILASISALLNILGYPKESLTIVRAADAMSTAPHQAMGISGQAMLLNNEGHALLGLRRWADAERVLRQAVALSPELSEAKVNLAVALLCQHEDTDALKFFRLGQYRKAYPMVAVNDMPNPDTAPDLNQAFDLSQGADGAYPTVQIPQTWQELDGDRGALWGQTQTDWLNRLSQYDQQIQQLKSQVDWLHLPAWVSSRYYQVMIAAYRVGSQPQIKALIDQWQAAWAAFNPFYFGYMHLANGLPAGKLPDLQNARLTWPECNADPPTPAACDARWQQECSNLNASEHASWLPLITAFDQITHKLGRVEYRAMTAVVANLADPTLHRIALLEVQRQWGFGTYVQLLNEVSRWAGYLNGSYCNAPPPTENPTLDDGVQKNSAPCPAALKGVKFSVKLGDFLKASVNCEQVGLEVASKSDVLWIGFFGEGSYNFVKGTGTLFAGVKAGGKIPETNVSVSAKEGLYMSIGGSGITDVGMRVSTSGSYGLVGGPTVDMKGPSYQISWTSQTITFE